MALPSGWASLRIYPPIGFARVGNSTLDDGWFYGPEVPGYFPEPNNGFKDINGAVKRQAARFRIYAVANDGKVLEITKKNGWDIAWKIQVMNKKASWYTFMGKTQDGHFESGYTTLRNPSVQAKLPPDQRDKLIVDSGIQSVSGCNAKSVPLAGKFYGSKTEPTDVYLGEARTDEQGRLVVLAGRGLSKSIAKEDDPYPYIMTDFDSPDWIDDTCDGWITATITSTASGKSVDAQGKARVIGTTPKFANGIYAPTSLYDLMEEVYERKKRAAQGDSYSVGDVSWYKHIWPLLQRPPLLSWVNGQANGGHGPNSAGNFFDEGWQNSLSDKSKVHEAIRKGVIMRMRLPETNKKYDSARAGQAYPYFMPWLSGDGGRTTAGDPSTFASVTELQYDRLIKWSEGSFDTTAVKTYQNFDDIPVEEQPSALTKAALEATIGAPLYPGIEMSWNAEDDKIYDFNTPFTIKPEVNAGDLTRFLSLPWQSDFYMCRSYWWPSARPDTVVTEEDYNIVSQSVTPANIAKKLNDRKPWERGLHQNYTDVYSDQPLFANTDMAKNWHKLGFIVQRPSFGPEPIFVETQRGIIHRPGKETLPAQHTPAKSGVVGGPLKLPQPDSKNQPITTIESLRTHLQTAMAIELATIPLYLFGMYSVKIPDEYANDPRYYDPVIGAIRGVVAEEMLHLSLAGNVLLAVGGNPKLYDPRYIPSYPAFMPGRVPKLWLQLRKASKANIQTFIDVEKREKTDAPPESDEYETLGQFYDAIKIGLKYLSSQNHKLFYPESAAFQFAPGLGYQAKERDAGGSVVVTDLDTALEALSIIVAQGEGSPGPYDDPDKLEKDHYDVFMDLRFGPAQWEVYPVVENPVTPDYFKIDRRIYQVSLTFDAAYCFLLRTIETLWHVEKYSNRQNLVLKNMYGIMMGVLAPLAKFLVSQPISNTERAAPCFGYYEFKQGVSELKQVQDEMAAAINAYVSVTKETPDQVAVHDYGAMLETLLPIQTTINNLVDLNSFEKLDVGPTKKFKLPGVENRGAKGFAKGA
uniref:Iminophenyl-pyruvate dimer synthase domain-containing protein n=1 Tax=Psilocybe cubensis TaxID=181762 RepID=A0A8H8CET3_PSICU